MSMETDAYVPGMSIYVPISGTDEAVAVKVDDLPDVADLLGLLQAELAPLGLWLDLAKAYLQRGMEEQFIEIMRTGCSEGACATSERARFPRRALGSRGGIPGRSRSPSSRSRL